jgi:hypothetical protein
MQISHPAEFKVHTYLDKARKGEVGMSEGTLSRVLSDMEEALRKQFSRGSDNKFRLRMSNIGRPTCQLWYDKNDPEGALQPSTTFLMNMMIGDIVEAVFKGILTEAGVEFEDGHNVELKLGKHTINGTHDLTMDGKVDDVKSASAWSYNNKFESFDTLHAHDSFGYVGQLVGYATALGMDVGGWWVVNKANGEFKYVPAEGVDVQAELDKMEHTADTVEAGKFERCFEPVPETFRGKPTGNTILNPECNWCNHKYKCWPDLIERESIPSKAKNPQMVSYITIVEED